MDASLPEELIASNKPFKIETASGRLFEVPHRNLVSFFHQEDRPVYLVRGKTGESILLLCRFSPSQRQWRVLDDGRAPKKRPELIPIDTNKTMQSK
jgi:hypothetical protein